jgi:hypothetical protein
MPLSAGTFPQDQPEATTASTNYQHYMIGADAKGAPALGGTMGVGRRTVPSPNEFFTNPAVSGGQFGSGHAKSQVRFGGNQEE